MKRVMVLGCSGSGKSTFARELSAILNVPVIHIDTLYWKPGWRQRRGKDFVARMIAAHEGEEWISDGNFLRGTGGQMRAARADAIIYLDQPRWNCLRRTFTRVFARPAGEAPAGYGRGYRHGFTLISLGYVLSFARDTAPYIEKLLATYPDRAVRLRGDAESAAYLAKLKESRAA